MDALNLGWYDTYLALTVPALFSALSTFLLRQYYRGIPLDLDEAARMDGASSLRIWWQIIVPLSWPVMAALAAPLPRALGVRTSSRQPRAQG